MSLEVGAVVVETSAQKSAASKEWHETLSHDAERATMLPSPCVSWYMR